MGFGIGGEVQHPPSRIGRPSKSIEQKLNIRQEFVGEKEKRRELRFLCGICDFRERAVRQKKLEGK